MKDSNFALPLLGAGLVSVEMPNNTIIATTKKMIQILNVDANGMIREWRFELCADGLVLYNAPPLMERGEIHEPTSNQLDHHEED